MKQIETNICIIGAGPAGVTTALMLAKKGISSVLVDRATFPRPKACGDNIIGNCLRVINEIDPNILNELEMRSSTTLPIKGIISHAPNNRTFQVEFLNLDSTEQASCYTIPRAEFDDVLFRYAKKQPLIQAMDGFKIDNLERTKSGIRIISSSNECEIQARLVVFATGSNSQLHQRIAPQPPVEDNHLAIGLRAYFRNVKMVYDTRYCEVFVSKNLMPGGLYITPFKDGLVNVNLVMRKDVVKKRNVNLRQKLEHELANHPLLKERFSEAKIEGKIEGSSLNLGTKKRKLSGDNYLMVGDSAGLIDLLSANGLPQAMLSGKIAAEFAEQCVKTGDYSAAALANYDERIFKRIEKYVQMSSLLAPMWDNPLFHYFSIALLNFGAKHFKRQEQIRDFLFYDNNVGKTIRSPLFYIRLLFGVKNVS